MKVLGPSARRGAAKLILGVVIAIVALGCSHTNAPTRPPTFAQSALATATATAAQTQTGGPTSGSTSGPTSGPTSAPVDPTDQVIPHAAMTYYDITGTTADQLRSELNTLGPISNNGSRYDATTSWWISWDWPGYGTRTCDLQAVTVTYEITVKFPHWIEPANPDPALVRKWTTYMAALATHEKGHVDFVVEHYQDIATAIKRATCTTADAAASAALDPIRQHDLDYDASTGHGATQGATFP